MWSSRERPGKPRASLETPRSRNRIVLEIRETNLAAQLFFRNSDFRAVSVLRDYYDDTTEDAYVMQYRYKEEVKALEAVNRIARLAG